MVPTPHPQSHTALRQVPLSQPPTPAQQHPPPSGEAHPSPSLCTPCSRGLERTSPSPLLTPHKCHLGGQHDLHTLPVPMLKPPPSQAGHQGQRRSFLLGCEGLGYLEGSRVGRALGCREEPGGRGGPSSDGKPWKRWLTCPNLGPRPSRKHWNGSKNEAGLQIS